MCNIEGVLDDELDLLPLYNVVWRDILGLQGLVLLARSNGNVPDRDSGIPDG